MFRAIALEASQGFILHVHVGYGVTKKRYNRDLNIHFCTGDTADFVALYITIENPYCNKQLDTPRGKSSNTQKPFPCSPCNKHYSQ